MVSDAFMISRALLTDAHKPALVVLGVNPRDFIDNDLPGLSATDAFKYMLPYVNLGNLDQAAYPEFFAHLDWVIDQYLPMKRVHLALQSALAQRITAMLPDSKNTQIRKDLKLSLTCDKVFLQTISGSAGDVKPGEWVVPCVMGNGYLDNTKEYLHRYHDPNPPIYACEKKFFRAFLADMQAKHIAVVVVGMPSQPCNRVLLPDSFWSQFRTYVTATCTEHGATFCDLTAAPQFVRPDYLDTVHLNSQGGDKLFKSIAEAICQNPKLATLPILNGKGQRGDRGDWENIGKSATLGSWH